MLLRPFIACTLILLMFLAPPMAVGQTDSDVIEQCESLLAADRPMPTGADAPSIRITSPTAGETVHGEAIAVTVETEHFDLNSEARHWHLWVNGELMGMVYQEVGIIDLSPGTYQICASLGNTDHADIGRPDGITMTVEQPGEGIPIPTLAVAREDAPVLDEPDVEPSQIVLIIGLGLAAAVGGWWVGSRLPRRK